MARIEPYRAGDWRKVEPRESELEAIRLLIKDVDPDPYYLHGPAFTIKDGDSSVICGGVFIRDDGGGDSWLFASAWVNTHMMVARIIKDFMLTIAKDYRLSWLQMLVDTRYPKTRRMAEWLGYSFWGAYSDVYHLYRRML